MKITIGGTPGSGKSTLATMMSERLDMDHVSIGDLRREIATREGMTLHEFNELGEDEAWTDEEIDQYQQDYAENHDDFIMESRLGWYFIEDSFDIYVDANPDERARRLADRDSEEESYTTKDEAKEANQQRLESDRRRYRQYYGIDPFRPEHYDLVIDSTDKPPETVLEIAMDAVA